MYDGTLLSYMILFILLFMCNSNEGKQKFLINAFNVVVVAAAAAAAAADNNNNNNNSSSSSNLNPNIIVVINAFWYLTNFHKFGR